MAEYDVLSYFLSPLSADFAFLLKMVIIGQNPPFEFDDYLKHCIIFLIRKIPRLFTNPSFISCFCFLPKWRQYSHFWGFLCSFSVLVFFVAHFVCCSQLLLSVPYGALCLRCFTMAGIFSLVWFLFFPPLLFFQDALNSQTLVHDIAFWACCLRGNAENGGDSLEKRIFRRIELGFLKPSSGCVH